MCPAAFYLIFKAEGLRGLYRGVTATAARAAVLTSAQLGSYDIIKNNILIQVFHMADGFKLHFCAAMVRDASLLKRLRI
jgi:hypothetical protein